eukprot:6179223-Pleurochrysis_carterae.AAC.1
MESIPAWAQRRGRGEQQRFSKAHKLARNSMATPTPNGEPRHIPRLNADVEGGEEEKHSNEIVGRDQGERRRKKKRKSKKGEGRCKRWAGERGRRVSGQLYGVRMRQLYGVRMRQ